MEEMVLAAAAVQASSIPKHPASVFFQVCLLRETLFCALVRNRLAGLR
jgi:hypothetical protein